MSNFRFFRAVLCCALTLACVLALGACGQKSSDVDAQKAALHIIETIEQNHHDDDLTAAPVLATPESLLADYFDDSVLTIPMKSRAAYTAEDLYDVADYAIFVLEDAADAEKILTSCRRRVADLARQYSDNYDLPQGEVVKTAIVGQRGNVVYLFITQQGKEAQALLLDILGGKVLLE